MTEPQSDCLIAFHDAIRKAAQENPELAAVFLGGDHNAEDIYEMLADHTAYGDGSILVYLAGREFAGKVLECLPNADEYSVCALIQDAILFCFSTRDDLGSLRSGNFYTLPYVEHLLQLGLPIELETEPA